MSHIAGRQLGTGLQLTCQGCGASVIVGAPWQSQQFQAVHAGCAPRLAPVDPGYYGMGDAVAAVARPIARVVGVDPNCAPCQQRQRELNRWFPRLWRR